MICIDELTSRVDEFYAQNIHNVLLCDRYVVFLNHTYEFLIVDYYRQLVHVHTLI